MVMVSTGFTGMLSNLTKHGELWMYLMVIFVMLLLLYFKSWVRSVQVALTLPGPPALPLIGNALLAANSKKLEAIGNTCSQRYGVLIRVWVSIIPFFIVFHPRDLQHILGSRKQADKNFFYALMYNFIGEGLITNNGHKWRLHRRLIQPFFHINILESFLDIFHKCALKFEPETGSDLKITSLINDLVLDILHHVVLGVPLDDAKGSPFRKGEVNVIHRATRPWLLLNLPFMFTNQAKKELTQKKRLREYTREIIYKKRKDLKNGTHHAEFKSVLEMLMEISDSDPKFSEDDVINEACTFMLAGQDSVGAAVAFSLYYFGQNQDVQEKAFQEVQNVFDTEKPTLEQLKSAVYLEQCIKETLRLCPSVPMFARRLAEDVVLGKHVLPAGSNVFISPFATHRLPDVFPEPLRYNPDRFSPENCQKIHPYAYFPFSMGPRNCIGHKFALLEMKIILATVLRQYHISSVPGKDLNLAYRVTLRAKGGIWLKFTKRTS